MNDDGHRHVGRPALPDAERQRRERERDRRKKQALRARTVERSLVLTRAQASKLDRHRRNGGFRSTSALIAAIVDKLPRNP